MVKMKRGGMLVLGITPNELEHLKQGAPLTIRLEDLGLKGQVIQIVPGESNEKLKAIMEEADRRISQARVPNIILQ